MEGVIVLHGIARTHRSMRRVCLALERSGYDVCNVGYPSTRRPLEDLVSIIARRTRSFLSWQDRRVHFVGYSLGGILARAVIHRIRPPNLGRVVQIAPPNQGSEVADFWRNFFLYRWIFGPAGQDLGAREKRFARILGPIDYELGVIAGNCTWDPLSSFLIDGPDDGKVSVSSTRVEGMADHIVIPATHTFIIYNPVTFQQMICFLRNGRFAREADG